MTPIYLDFNASTPVAPVLVTIMHANNEVVGRLRDVVPAMLSAA